MMHSNLSNVNINDRELEQGCENRVKVDDVDARENLKGNIFDILR